MRSSTSSSDKKLREATAALLLGALAIAAFFEVGSRYGFTRISRIQSRIAHERAAFVSTRDPKAAVLLGNSLLVSDVDMDQLNAELSRDGARSFSRFAIEQTSYLDWYFGLKNLFARGARPGTVVLLFDASHWLSPAVRGEYFARELLGERDLFELQKTLGLDRTALSGYGFANLSAWLGGRSEIRKFLLGKVLPPITPFLVKVGSHPFQYPDVKTAYETIYPRMESLKQLCDSYGVRLVLAIPPTLEGIEAQDAIFQAASKLGLTAMRPAAPGSFSRNLFGEDGYHLNAEGGRDFTHQLAGRLKSI